MKPIYLNHAGTSWPKPAAVQQAVTNAMLASPQDWPDRFHQAHQSICRYFEIPHPDQLLLTPGCTSAIAVGIFDLPWQAGDQVLISHWEHHALHRPLLKLQDRGVEILIAPLGAESAVDLNRVQEILKNGNVRLVATTAACNATGELIPYAEIINLAHQFNALALIDAAQVVGWLKLNFTQLNADLVAFGGHKGLQAPWGIGGLYVAEHVPMQCTSATCELPLTLKNSSRLPRPGYCDVGSVDQWALAGLAAGLQWLQTEAPQEQLNRGRLMAKQLREHLTKVSGIKLHGSPDPTRSLPTVAFSVPNVESTQIATLMAEQGLTVGSGLQCAPLAHAALGTEKFGTVRISFGVGQSQGEMNSAVERITAFCHEEFSSHD